METKSRNNEVAWRSFKGESWKANIDVRTFIIENTTPYYGDEAFLEKPLPRIEVLRTKMNALIKLEETKGGVLDIDTDRVSSLLSYAPGFIDRDKERIFGLQTDAPLKRGCQSLRRHSNG